MNNFKEIIFERIPIYSQYFGYSSFLNKEIYKSFKIDFNRCNIWIQKKLQCNVETFTKKLQTHSQFWPELYKKYFNAISILSCTQICLAPIFTKLTNLYFSAGSIVTEIPEYVAKNNNISQSIKINIWPYCHHLTVQKNLCIRTPPFDSGNISELLQIELSFDLKKDILETTVTSFLL